MKANLPAGQPLPRNSMDEEIMDSYEFNCLTIQTIKAIIARETTFKVIRSRSCRTFEKIFHLDKDMDEDMGIAANFSLRRLLIKVTRSIKNFIKIDA
jgi:hypothetical protein